MTEKALTDNQASALSDTTDATSGVVYPSATQRNWAATGYRLFERIIEAFIRANDLRVYEIEDNADAVGVRSGRVTFGATALAYTQEDPAVDGLTDNDTTYIWLYNNAGAATIGSALDGGSGGGWPSVPHYKLAEVTMSGGAITAILDRRAERCSDVLLPTYTNATRPAPGTAGRLIFNSDDGQINIDDGTNWTLPDGTTT
jgi:hypothetical protein